MGRWDHGNVRCQRTFPRWTFQADVGPPPPPDVGTFGADVGPPPPTSRGDVGRQRRWGGGDVNLVGGRSILELATKPASSVSAGDSMPAGRTQQRPIGLSVPGGRRPPGPPPAGRGQFKLGQEYPARRASTNFHGHPPQRVKLPLAPVV